MATSTEIAEALLAACLSADHNPGKVQFTKYLYLLDYCHWHLTGRKATAFPWRFYHYGPWCEEVETCMAGLAERYQFGWREEEAAIVRSVQVRALETAQAQNRQRLNALFASLLDRAFKGEL